MSDIYEIFETSGADKGKLLGWMKFDGCEPLYRPSPRSVCRYCIKRPKSCWIDLDEWRRWTGRTLSDLRIVRQGENED